MTDSSNEARAAFDNAIKEARLSDAPQAWNFAGSFMYMGREAGLDLFKHIMTRRYIGALPLRWEVMD